MGLCESEKKPTEDNFTCGYEDTEDSITWESRTDCEYIAESLFALDQGLKYPGGIGISNFNLPSDCQLTLTKPLIGRDCAVLYKSENKFFEKNVAFYEEPLTEVTQQLFFGAFDDANNERKLKGLEITHIISLIGPKHEIEGIKHKHMPISDFGRTDLKRVLTTLWPFILESQQLGNKLFIHCQSGQNRSATVMLSILMKLKSEKLNVLYRMVKKKRPIIQINEKYARQLSEMETEMFGETTVPQRWMSISSYDMESGDVEFNEELEMEASAWETGGTVSNEGVESNEVSISADLSTEELELLSRNDYELSRPTDLSPNAEMCNTVRMCFTVD